tara:strand:- start:18645 stop:18812 length:168 start_codon:yes stop_codon:yes gene_type:complete
MNQEQLSFEMHCREDLYFFCPLCEDYHKKIKDASTGQLKGHSLCQMPVENYNDKY